MSKLAELRSFDIGSNRFIGELPAGLFETTAQLESLKCDRHSSCTSVNKTHLSATVDDTVLMYSEWARIALLAASTEYANPSKP